MQRGERHTLLSPGAGTDGRRERTRPSNQRHQLRASRQLTENRYAERWVRCLPAAARSPAAPQASQKLQGRRFLIDCAPAAANGEAKSRALTFLPCIHPRFPSRCAAPAARRRARKDRSPAKFPPAPRTPRRPPPAAGRTERQSPTWEQHTLEIEDDEDEGAH